MSRTVKSKDSNGIVNTLVLEDADMAALLLLKSRSKGSFKLSITAASADGDVIFITQKGRIYEMQRKDVFK
jgi:hypothetical protein